MDHPAVDAFLTRRRIALWRVVLCASLVLLCLAPSRWNDAWTGALLVTAGILLVALATVGRLWCALYVSGRKQAELVTQGPYSLCRHPLYVCNLLGLLGLGALAESLLLTAALGLAFALLYPAVMRSEERLLADRFPGYAAYARSTPRFLPRPTLYRTEATWLVDVRVYLRNVADSVWFILSAILIELVDRGHEAGLLTARWLLV